MNPTGITTKQVNPLLPGHADVYVGVLTLPYYLSKGAPLTEYWHAPPFPLDKTSTFVTRFNPLPVPTQTLQIPVLVTVPNASSALGRHAARGRLAGHDLPARHHAQPRGHVRQSPTPSRTPVPWSSPSTCRCMASPRPSMPLIRPVPLRKRRQSAVRRPRAPGERLDRAHVSICRTITGAGGQIDPSGSHFINLTSVLTSRDNLRQGAADLIALTRTLPQLNVGARGSIDHTKIHYLGHSLGAIVGGCLHGRHRQRGRHRDARHARRRDRGPAA